MFTDVLTERKSVTDGRTDEQRVSRFATNESRRGREILRYRCISRYSNIEPEISNQIRLQLQVRFTFSGIFYSEVYACKRLFSNTLHRQQATGPET